jgi:hypothetical protein
MPSIIGLDPPDQRTWPTSDSYIKFADAPEPPWVYIPPPTPEPRRTVPDARLRRLAALIHNLGPRALWELLRELVAGRDLVERLERYAAIDPDILEALGGARFPELLRAVPSDRSVH